MLKIENAVENARYKESGFEINSYKFCMYVEACFEAIGMRCLVFKCFEAEIRESPKAFVRFRNKAG